MTVRELILELQAMPQDAVVLNKMMSDYDILDPRKITIAGPERELVALRDGKYMRVYKHQFTPDEIPVWVNCIIFPGN